MYNCKTIPKNGKQYKCTNNEGKAAQGQDYEIFMTILVGLRCYQNSWKFHIGTHLDIAHPFDDLVVAYHDGKISHVWAIQLKHGVSCKINANTLTSPKRNDFSIPWYCSQLKFGENKILNYCNSLGEEYRQAKIQYGLYTVQMTNINVLRERFDHCILDTGGYFSKFDIEEFYSLAGCSSTETDKIKFEQFLANFFLYTNAADVNNLRRIIVCDVKKIFGLCDNEAEGVLRILYEDIKHWWGQTRRQFTLTESHDIWRNCIQHVLTSLPRKLAIDQPKILFKAEYLQTTMRKLFLQQQIVQIVDESSDNLLKLHLLCQVLGESAFFVTRSENLDARWTSVNCLWSSKWFDILVVYFADYLHEDNLKYLSEKLCSFISQHPQKRAVLVGLNSEYRECFPNKLEINITAEHLHPDTQRMLEMKEIIFQGQTVSLEDIINLFQSSQNHLYAYIKGKVICQLLNEAPIEVAFPLEKPIPYFVPRDIKGNQNISVTNVMTLKNQRQICVSGGPGFGKSEFIKKIAYETKKEVGAKWWVVVVKCRDHEDLFSSNDYLAERVLKKSSFKILHSMNTFESCLFEYFKKLEHFVILIDAADEVNPYYNAQFLEMCTSIKKLTFKCGFLWILTRPVCVQNISKVLKIPVYELCTFRKDDIELFFKSFFSVELKTNSTHYFQKCMYLVNSSGPGIIDIAKIPLMTRIIAEVITDLKECETLQNVTPIYLYDRFVKSKILRSLNKRKNTDVVDIVSDTNNLEAYEAVYEKHQILALFYVLPKKCFEELSKRLSKKVDILIKEFEKSTEKTGLIVTCQRDKLVFLHKTIAEYLAATWFADNFEDKTDFLRKYYPSSWEVWTFLDLINSGDQQLLYAVVERDLFAVQRFLDVQSNFESVKVKNNAGQTALHLSVAVLCRQAFNIVWSSESSQPSAQRILYIILEQDVNIHEVDQLLEFTATEYLDAFAKTGDFCLAFSTLAELFLMYGAKTEHLQHMVQQRNLLSVAEMGYSKLLEALTSFGKSLEVTDENGWTALHKVVLSSGNVMALSDFLQCLNLLLANGGNPYAKDFLNGDTPVHIAAYKSEKFLEEFVKAGIDLDCANDNGDTPLHYACLAGKSSCVNLLTQNVSNINIANRQGHTGLHLAIHHKRNECLKILLTILCCNQLTDIGVNGTTIVHMVTTIFHSNIEFMKFFLHYLIQKGISFPWNMLDDFGITWFHSVIEESVSNSLETFLSILKEENEIKIDFEYENQFGRNAISVLENKGQDYLNILSKFLQNYRTILDSENMTSDFGISEYEESEDFIKNMLSNLKETDLNLRDRQGRTLLHIASEQNNLEHLQSLISFVAENGFCLNFYSRDNSGRTPLHLATASNNSEILRIILETASNDHKPLNLNVRDSAGKSIIHVIAENENLSCVETFFSVIKSTGSEVLWNLHARDKQCNTIVHCVAGNHNGKCIDHLLKFVYENRIFLWEERNAKGEIPLHTVAQNPSHEAIDSFLKFIKSAHVPLNWQARDCEHNTWLHFLMANNKIQAVEALLNFAVLEGVSLDFKVMNLKGYSALHLAVTGTTAENIRAIQNYLINKNLYLDFDVLDRKNRTLMHLAVINRNPRGFQALFEMSKRKNTSNNCNFTDSDGRTLLHEIVSSTDPIFVKTIMEIFEVENMTLNWNAEDCKKTSILLEIASNCCPQAVESLLQFVDKKHIQFNWSTINNAGETVLHKVSQNSNPICIHMMLEFIDRLNVSLDWNAVDKTGLSVLHFIVSNTNDECNKILFAFVVNKSININWNGANPFSHPVLLTALRNRNRECFKRFLDSANIMKASINWDVRNGSEGHILLESIKKNDLELLLLILNYTKKHQVLLNWNAVDYWGRSVLHYLILYAEKEFLCNFFQLVCEWSIFLPWHIIDTETQSTVIHFLAWKRTEEGFDTFLQYLDENLYRIPINWNAKDNLGRTPWHVLACNTDEYCVRHLLQFVFEKKIYIDLMARDNSGRQFLHILVINSNANCIETFLSIIEEQNIYYNWNEKDFKGNSVLHSASRNTNAKSIEIIFKILNNKNIKIDLNACNINERSVLHEFVGNSNASCVNMLLTTAEHLGIVLNGESKDYLGHTAFYTAARRHLDTDIFRTLLIFVERNVIKFYLNQLSLDSTCSKECIEILLKTINK